MEDNSLKCIICPREPRFSDISHLLTHAASKAHLSHCFAVKVRCKYDPDAVELLKRYDDWFDANGYDTQLAARMAGKERRKKRKSDRALTANTAKCTKSQAPNVESESSNIPATTTTSGPECLDPRLADHGDQQRHANANLTPTTPSPLPITNNKAIFRMGPTLRSVQSSNGTNSNMLQPVHASGLGNEARSLALPVTPIQRRRRPEPLERTWISDRDTPDPFIDSGDQIQASGDQTQTSGDAEIAKSQAEEMARLKGVLWPGMNIFDSATEQMRRRRNQRKDTAVLTMMERDSSLVEANEMVFSPGGSLQTQREITGNVEEHSLLEGETPIPKRALTRTRTTRLTKADPNVPRAADRKRQKTDKDRKNIEEPIKEEQDYPRHSGLAADRTHTYVGDDEEFGLTVNTFGTRPRGGFNVFVDNGQIEEVNKPSYQDPGFRTQFDTLTPTRLVLNGKMNTGILTSRIGHTFVDKENIEPILNPQGRIGPYDWHSPFAKRANPDAFGFGPPHFSDIGDAYDNFDKAGYLFNPLQAPSKYPFYDNPYEKAHDASQNGWFSMEQTAPSEETVSEEDQMLQACYLTTDAN
ncbi:Terpenoid cyclases/protein prenyltransferase alpha-alpha toroid [Penicillium coprophilum]|uniref:Terpenoid cyclases/protein prenyltransferase alpha-alpha toroid n=1 Tax=Penicillium coprophilum TaxID=36646 RepID=UPI00239A9AD2|nr:Terpenoid cyclases/protein prenyltransferase alpha-alpha toroid [Penicillium coprophilum]KAJ5177703.1 Terpenoid cyclases/protein prenyltransferase alpha-alpha toroid [Penicillium coprophilum]